MAELDQAFVVADVPADDRAFEPIPAGSYKLQVIDSEIRETKAQDGDQQLVLTLEVLEGPYANRRIWDRLNIRNKSADAQRIAQQALGNLCFTLNLPVLRNSEDLHFKPFVARVGIRTDKTGQYGPQNTVRYPREGAAPARPATQTAQTTPATQVAKPQTHTGAKPWLKGS